jgi:hypothetical protein
MSDSNVLDPVLLVDFIAALGGGSKAELAAACPFPVLVDVTSAPASAGEEGKSPDVVLLRRLDAALGAADVTLHLLEPQSPVTIGNERFVVRGLEPLRFVARGASWSVEDTGLPGGLEVEGRRRPPGSRVPLGAEGKSIVSSLGSSGVSLSSSTASQFGVVSEASEQILPLVFASV